MIAEMTNLLTKKSLRGDSVKDVKTFDEGPEFPTAPFLHGRNMPGYRADFLWTFFLKVPKATSVLRRGNFIENVD